MAVPTGVISPAPNAVTARLASMISNVGASAAMTRLDARRASPIDSTRRRFHRPVVATMIGEETA